MRVLYERARGGRGSERGRGEKEREGERGVLNIEKYNKRIGDERQTEQEKMLID